VPKSSIGEKVLPLNTLSSEIVTNQENLGLFLKNESAVPVTSIVKRKPLGDITEACLHSKEF